jgi:uncharacterized membrane protein
MSSMPSVVLPSVHRLGEEDANVRSQKIFALTCILGQIFGLILKAVTAANTDHPVADFDLIIL